MQQQFDLVDMARIHGRQFVSDMLVRGLNTPKGEEGHIAWESLANRFSHVCDALTPHWRHQTHNASDAEYRQIETYRESIPQLAFESSTSSAATPPSGYSLLLNPANSILNLAFRSGWDRKRGWRVSDLIPTESVSGFDIQQRFEADVILMSQDATNIIGADFRVKPNQEALSLQQGEFRLLRPELDVNHVMTSLNWEAVQQDQTGKLVQNVMKLGIEFRKRDDDEADRCFLGITPNYKEQLSASASLNSYNTYYTLGDAGPWINAIADNPITDRTSFDAADILLRKMVHPKTGESLGFEPEHIIVMTASKYLAKGLLWPSQASIAATAGASNNNVVINPAASYTRFLNQMYDNYRMEQLLFNPDPLRGYTGGSVPSETLAGSYWYFGNVGEMMVKLEGYPATITEAPGKVETREIMRYSALAQRVYWVKQPRAMIRCAKS